MMSLSISNGQNCWILCHQKSSQVTLKCDQNINSPEETHQVLLSSKLFDIPEPYKLQKAGRSVNQESEPSVKPDELAVDAVKVKALYESMKNDDSVLKRLNLTTKIQMNADRSLKAVEFAENFFKTVRNIEFKPFVEINDSPVGNQRLVFDTEGNFHRFYVPQNSRIYCDDVTNLGAHFSEPQFSLVVIDPPWRNKYIRRRKRQHLEAGYHMMYNQEIRNIPLELVLKEKALVAVWCTNSKQHQHEILNSFFPKWGVKFVTKWYWLKVTNQFVPVCPFNEETKKQPFEVLILGRRCESLEEMKTIQECVGDTGLMISIPSAINSHKPPLLEVLRPLLLEDDICSSTCLELFARYATPGFTSYGNEVIKLMHESLYEPVGEIKCHCLQSISGGK